MWRFSFLITITLFVSACNMEEAPKTSESTQDSFYVLEPVNADSEILSTTSDYISVIRFKFTACLKDSSRHEELMEQPILITGDSLNVHTKTDRQGCLQWEKEYRIHQQALALYLPETITFASTGIYKGSVTLEFAINPWVVARRLRIDAFKDFRKSKPEFVVPKELVEKAKNGELKRENYSVLSSFSNIDDYHFDTLTLKYGGVDVHDERSTSRTVKILVTACIYDSKYFAPVRDRYFQVDVQLRPDPTTPTILATRLNPSEPIILQTDHDGCIRWTDRLNHKIYERERFFVKDYFIKDVSTGLTKKLSGSINPWDTGWLFARDIREVDPDEISKISDEAPELFIDNFSLQARGAEYAIDKYLRLTVKRKYILLIEPEVIRHDSLSQGRFGNQDLRDGIYMLKMVLVRNFIDERASGDMYVNSWEQLVKVRAGEIVVPIYFDLNDLTLMGSRNRVLIQLLPVDEDKVIFLPDQYHLSFDKRMIDQERSLAQRNLIDRNSGLMTTTYTGPFIPIYEGQGSPLIPSQISSEKYIELGKEWISQREQIYENEHVLSIYDNKFRLKYINLKDAKDLEWFTTDSEIWKSDVESMRNYMASGTLDSSLRQQLGKRMCSFWFDKLIPDIFAREQERINLHEKNKMFQDQLQDQKRELSKVRSSFAKTRDGLLEFCTQSEEKGEAFFSFDNKLIVNKLGANNIRYMGGTSFNYNVGANFSLSKSEDWEVGFSHSSSSSFSASVGANVGFADVNIGRQESWSADESHGYSSGRDTSLSYGAGAYLVVQHSIFRLDLMDYERCLIVKPRWKLVEKLLEDHLKAIEENVGWFDKITSIFKPSDLNEAEWMSELKSTMDSELYLDLSDSGIRVCKGEPETHPINVTENYYYITQHFTSGDMHDVTDLRNRPWLMSIRGIRDFRVFIESIHNHNSLQDVGRHNANVPIEILKESYSEYNERQPSWPRLYSYYPYNQRELTDCDKDINLIDNLMELAKDIAKGPYRAKSGSGMPGGGIDFWSIYYCPQD